MIIMRAPAVAIMTIIAMGEIAAVTMAVGVSRIMDRGHIIAQPMVGFPVIMRLNMKKILTI
jgi:hypothetical protein